MVGNKKIFEKINYFGGPYLDGPELGNYFIFGFFCVFVFVGKF